MTRILDLLPKFDRTNDLENPVASFRTLTAWVAPEAYLCIVFKPVSESLLEHSSSQIDLPPDLKRFYLLQNGADLFSGRLYIYGLVDPTQILKRSDPYSLPPFSLFDENRRPNGRSLSIGSYSHISARVVLDVATQRVTVESEVTGRVIGEWSGIEDWLDCEVARMCDLFDSAGHPLAEESIISMPNTPRLN